MRLSLAGPTLTATLLAGANAAGEEKPPRTPWVFVAGPSFGIEDGVRTMTGLGRMVFSYDDFIAAHVPLDEGTAWGKILGVGGRLTKLFFVDRPLVAGQTLVTHEVFGHGARAREADLDPTYEFHLVAPYSWIFSDDEGPAGVTNDARTGVPERDITMITGGLESDHWGAWWLNYDAMRNGGFMSYHDWLQYIDAKLSYMDRLGVTLSRPPTEDLLYSDPDQYVSELQNRFNRWRPTDRSSIAEPLRIAYVFNFVDPTFWQSVYHLFFTYLYEGERDAQLLTIPLGEDVTLYPATRFNLGPFGAEHYLDLFVGYRDWTFDLYARAGSSGLASYWGGGVRAGGPTGARGLALRGELDLWTQPEMLFDARFVFERDNQPGIGAGLHAEWHIYGPLMLTGKLAAKSKGHLMGQPIDPGPYGYFGIAIAPGRAGATFGP